MGTRDILRFAVATVGWPRGAHTPLASGSLSGLRARLRGPGRTGPWAPRSRSLPFRRHPYDGSLPPRPGPLGPSAEPDAATFIDLRSASGLYQTRRGVPLRTAPLSTGAGRETLLSFSGNLSFLPIPDSFQRTFRKIARIIRLIEFARSRGERRGDPRATDISRCCPFII